MFNPVSPLSWKIPDARLASRESCAYVLVAALKAGGQVVEYQGKVRHADGHLLLRRLPVKALLLTAAGMGEWCNSFYPSCYDSSVNTALGTE